MSDEQNPEQDTSSERPDPFFKFLTRLEAEQHGLIAKETERQFSTRADLVLNVPPGISLENTMFDFFRRVNVLEFKSQGDKFNLKEYARNAIRTYLQFLQEEDEDFDNILNIIVSSRRPRNFFSFARKHRVKFIKDKEKPWLWRAQVGFQNVVVVTCGDLPLEERYYYWLIFAPAKSEKWKELVRELLIRGEEQLLDTIRRMRPKEFNMASIDIIERMKAEGLLPVETDDPEVEELDAKLGELVLEDLAKRKSRKLSGVLSKLSPETRLEGLKAQDRLAGLTQEERQQLLKLLTEETEE